MRCNVCFVGVTPLILLAVLCCTTTSAQTWQGDEIGDEHNWMNGGNWDGGSVPNGGTVFVNQTNAGNYPIISTVVPNTGDLYVGSFGASPSRLDVVSGGSVTAGRFEVAPDSTSTDSTVNLSSGGAITSRYWFFLGRDGGSNGTFNLNGGSVHTNSEFDNTVIGNATNATGALNVNGGTFSVGSAATGNNGGEFWVGNEGSGTVTQDSPSSVVSTYRYFVIGRGSTGVGEYNLQAGTVNAATGAGLTAIASTEGASGTLNVSGGTFNSTNGILVGEAFFGGSGTATGVVNISGSGLVNTGLSNTQLAVGANSSGTLNLNGGTLQTGQVSQGSGAGGGAVNFNGGTLKATRDNGDFLTGVAAATVSGTASAIDNAGHAIGVGQVLTGAGGMTFTDSSGTGSGVTTLTGANTYSGATTVSGGTLLLGDGVSGSLLSNVDVNAGATFGGSGDGTSAVDVTGNLTFTGSVGSVATFAPGSSIGSLDVLGNVSLDSNSVLQIEYDSTLQTIDSINIVGQLSFLSGATINFAEFNPGVLTEGEYVFADFLSTNGFSLGDLNLTNVPGGYEVSLSSTSMSLVVAAIPEVSGFFCLGLVSAATLSGVARRRVRAAG